MNKDPNYTNINPSDEVYKHSIEGYDSREIKSKENQSQEQNEAEQSEAKLLEKTVKKEEKTKKNNRKFKFTPKRKASGTVVLCGIIFIIFLGGAVLLSPAVALLNIKEQVANDLNDTLIAYNIFSRKVLKNQIMSLDGKNGDCDKSSKENSILCKFNTMSANSKDKFEKYGFIIPTVGDSKYTFTAKVADKDEPDDFDSVVVKNGTSKSDENGQYVRYAIPAIVLPGASIDPKDLAFSAISNPKGFAKTLPDLPIKLFENSKIVYNPGDGIIPKLISGSPGLGHLVGLDMFKNSSFDKMMNRDKPSTLIDNVFDPRYSIFQDRIFPRRIYERFGVKQNPEIKGFTTTDVAESFNDVMLRKDKDYMDRSGDGVYGLLYLASNRNHLRDLYDSIANNPRNHQELMCSLYTFGNVLENSMQRARITSQVRFAMQYLGVADKIKSGDSSTYESAISYLMSNYTNEQPIAPGGIGGVSIGFNSPSRLSGFDAMTYQALTGTRPLDYKSLLGKAEEVRSQSTDGLLGVDHYLRKIVSGVDGAMLDDAVDGIDGKINLTKLPLPKIGEYAASDFKGALKSEVVDRVKSTAGESVIGSTRSIRNSVESINKNNANNPRKACVDSLSSDQSDAERNGEIDGKNMRPMPVDSLMSGLSGDVGKGDCYKKMAFVATDNVSLLSGMAYRFVVNKIPEIIKKIPTPEALSTLTKDAIVEAIKKALSCDAMAKDTAHFARFTKLFMDIPIKLLILNKFAPEAINTEVKFADSDTSGEDAQNAIFAGASAIFSDTAQSIGMRPASLLSYGEYLMSDEYNSLKEKILKSVSLASIDKPFDVNNPYSFVSRVLTGVYGEDNLSKLSVNKIASINSIPGLYSRALSQTTKTASAYIPTSISGKIDYLSRFMIANPFKRCGFISADKNSDDNKMTMAMNLDQLKSFVGTNGIESFYSSITPDFGCNLRWSMSQDTLNRNVNDVVSYMMNTNQPSTNEDWKSHNFNVDETLGDRIKKEAELDTSKTFINKTTGAPNMKTDYGRFIQFCVNRRDPYGSIGMVHAPRLRKFRLDDRSYKGGSSSKEDFVSAGYNYIDIDKDGNPTAKSVGELEQENSDSIMGRMWGSDTDQEWISGKKCLENSDELKNFRAYTAMCRVMADMSGANECWTNDSISTATSTFYSRNGIIFSKEN